MWTRWSSKLCIAVAAAALAACTQEVNDDQQSRASLSERQKMEISVMGCVQAGTGTTAYMLTHVQPAPLGSQPTDAMSAAHLTLADNSAIRLSSEDTERLTGLVGQRVTVTGLLRDDGRNTIGTSGAPTPGENQAEPRTDRSQAGTDQSAAEKVREEAGPIGNRSLNNGTYPEMIVERISGSGQKCGGEG
jgi:hypothetical protein